MPAFSEGFRELVMWYVSEVGKGWLFRGVERQVDFL